MRIALVLTLVCIVGLTATRGISSEYPSDGARLNIRAKVYGPDRLCLAAENGSRDKKALITVQDCKGGIEHGWRFDYDGGGDQYRFVSDASGLCLDVTKSSQRERAQVIQYPCHRGANQAFHLKHVRGHEYQIVADHSGLCLGVNWVGVGEVLVQQYCEDSYPDSQIWTFHLPGPPSPIVAPKPNPIAPVKPAKPVTPPKAAVIPPSPVTPPKKQHHQPIPPPVVVAKPKKPRPVPTGPNPEPMEPTPSESDGKSLVTPDDGNSPLGWPGRVK